MFLGSYPLKLKMYSPAWGCHICLGVSILVMLRRGFHTCLSCIQVKRCCKPPLHIHTQPFCTFKSCWRAHFKKVGHMENSVLTLSCCLSSQVEDGNAEDGQTVGRRSRLQLKQVAVEASTRVRESSPRCFFERFFLWSSRGYWSYFGENIISFHFHTDLSEKKIHHSYSILI